MMFHQVYTLTYRFFGIVEAAQPGTEVDVAILHHVQVVLRHAPLTHVLQHQFAVHVLYPAVGMADNHDFLHAQLVDGHQQAAHHTSKRMHDGTAGVLDELHIAVLQAQCRGEQLYQAGIHTGYDCYFLVRVFGGDVFLIPFLCHKGFIEFQ